MLAAVASSIQYPLDALYRPLHNSVMERFFISIRSRFGASVIPAKKAARAILKLRKENRAFGIIGDQNPRRRDDKYWTIFMGVETPVAVGPERIAKLTGYPLFYVSMERLSRGRYRCVIAPLLESPYRGEGEISQKYMSVVEENIRKQPEFWMWSHHRWRYTREECPKTE
jgi:KDO2-lipid IV(A) lauroyltransferase